MPAPAQTAEPPNVLAPIDKYGPPAPVDTETLVEGFRYLQQRIPRFTQLSVKEQRSMTRAAYLDPEFVAAGVHVAMIWDHAEALIRRPRAALQQDAENIPRGNVLAREVAALFSGIRAINLKRKHRLGRDILLIYKFLGSLLQDRMPEHAYLRPYYEEMQRLYHKNLTRKPRKRPKEEKSETPKG